MSKDSYSLQVVHDASGEPLGVFIPLAVWRKVEGMVEKTIEREQQRAREKPEPLSDWETLKQFWDFRYPVDMDVTCGECGSTTVDWQEDEPRKFKLLAANLGGLVTFRCQECRAKIIKRHFKDHIAVETKPMSS